MGLTKRQRAVVEYIRQHGTAPAVQAILDRWKASPHHADAYPEQMVAEIEAALPPPREVQGSAALAWTDYPSMRGGEPPAPAPDPAEQARLAATYPTMFAENGTPKE
jgi:hypothetical protein